MEASLLPVGWRSPSVVLCLLFPPRVLLQSLLPHCPATSGKHLDFASSWHMYSCCRPFFWGPLCHLFPFLLYTHSSPRSLTCRFCPPDLHTSLRHWDLGFPLLRPPPAAMGSVVRFHIRLAPEAPAQPGVIPSPSSPLLPSSCSEEVTHSKSSYRGGTRLV